MRLIDADAIFDDCIFSDMTFERDLKIFIDSFDTIDAVPVVRCKDCKHRDPEDRKCDSGALERAGCVFPVEDDYFCAWGERREE